MNFIQEFFDTKAPVWDDICKHDPKRLEQILDYAKVGEGQVILDVACGTGVLEQPLLKRNPGRIHAIDLSEQMIAHAKDKMDDERVLFEAKDFLGMDETGYDIVIVHNAYPHFLDKEAFKNALYKTLKPGGRFIVAHSASRNEINTCHHKLDFKLSEPLKPVEQEADTFSGIFMIDTLVDNEYIYILSGIKPEK